MTDKPKSNVEWEKWGELDPLYGVASWAGRARGDAHQWTDADFYKLGESDWRDFRTAWREYGVSLGTCIEIGCGAGRLTRQLAQDFEAVLAFDVSPGMLEYARANSTADNVRFLLSSGTTLTAADRTADAVFSTHVFQHFDDLTTATEYFSEMSRVLRPGGTIMIHLPVYRWPGSPMLHRTLHRMRSRISDVKAAMARRQIRRGRWVPLMRGLVYEEQWLFDQLEHAGFVRVQLKTIRVSSNGALHTFVHAAMPADSTN